MTAVPPAWQWAYYLTAGAGSLLLLTWLAVMIRRAARRARAARALLQEITPAPPPGASEDGPAGPAWM